MLQKGENEANNPELVYNKKMKVYGEMADRQLKEIIQTMLSYGQADFSPDQPLVTEGCHETEGSDMQDSLFE